MPLFYCKRGQKFLKNPIEKGVVFNSQNYDGYPLLIVLTLPGLESDVFRPRKINVFVLIRKKLKNDKGVQFFILLIYFF